MSSFKHLGPIDIPGSQPLSSISANLKSLDSARISPGFAGMTGSF
jgi:hypothetical protein